MDKVFISKFWNELFTSVGTKIHLNTSYHPHTNGKTEWLNSYLEQYLRAITSSRPRQWTRWISLAEWWYNSTYNSAIKMSLFEALYGIKPRKLCIPSAHTSSVDFVLNF